jgi:hypothetical protein
MSLYKSITKKQIKNILVETRYDNWYGKWMKAANKQSEGDTVRNDWLELKWEKDKNKPYICT